jgi:hypothetical protein
MEPSLIIDYENKVHFQLALGHYKPVIYDPAKAFIVPWNAELV